MQALLATAPLLTACLLLAVGIGAVRAALVSVVCALLVAATTFPVPAERAWSTAQSLGATTAEVLAILLGGVLLSELLATSGAQQRLAEWVRRSCADPGRAVLLIVLGITPFAESVTGFGMGVVVGVPLLRHVGLSATKSAVLGLLGLVIVPWGALAPGTLVAAQLGDVGFQALGVRSAELSGAVFVLVGLAALVVAQGRHRAPAYLFDLVVVAGLLWAGVWTANLLLGTPLAGAVGSLVAIAAALGLSRLRDRVPVRVDAGTRWALRPYGLLVSGLLLSSLALKAADATGAWQLAAGPAPWLAVTCLVSPSLLGLRGPTVRTALATALRRWQPIALATALFLVLGGVLTAARMSAELAEAVSRLGPPYLFVAAVVGALGGFVAGSNTGANAMFAASQAQAAQALGTSTVQMLATQNVSASLLTMASPPRVALATSLAGETPVSTRTVMGTVLAVDGVVVVVLGLLNALLS